ncbi:MAG: SRPBCC domain-containing protein [Candidatus Acidiferrum sp.]
MSIINFLQPSRWNPTRRQVIAGVTFALSGIAVGSAEAVGAGTSDDEISHTEESIHQEIVFKSSRKRVYEALMDAKQFQKVTMLSEAVTSGMAHGTVAAEIAAEPGGAFKLFDGFIVGRNLELVPNERIVQAWRVSYWPTGTWSIARFDLVEQGSDTKVVFNHAGFPKGDAGHLAEGWKGNYWEPLTKFLAS